MLVVHCSGLEREWGWQKGLFNSLSHFDSGSSGTGFSTDS